MGPDARNARPALSPSVEAIHLAEAIVDAYPAVARDSEEDDADAGDGSAAGVGEAPNPGS